MFGGPKHILGSDTKWVSEEKAVVAKLGLSL
jgi:hypothetical protein